MTEEDRLKDVFEAEKKAWLDDGKKEPFQPRIEIDDRDYTVRLVKNGEVLFSVKRDFVTNRLLNVIEKVALECMELHDASVS